MKDSGEENENLLRQNYSDPTENLYREIEVRGIAQPDFFEIYHLT